MNEEAQNIVAEQLTHLPDDLLETVRAPDTAAAIDEICGQHNLTEEQKRRFADEVYLTLMGLESPGDFAGNVQRALQIPVQASITLAGDTHDRIFEPVAESLETLISRQLEEAGEAEEVPAEQVNRESDEYPDHAPAAGEQRVADRDRSEQLDGKRYPGNADPYREPIE